MSMAACRVRSLWASEASSLASGELVRPCHIQAILKPVGSRCPTSLIEFLGAHQVVVIGSFLHNSFDWLMEGVP